MEKFSIKTQKNKIPLIDFFKFRGKELAVIDGKVVAEGKSSKEAFEKAKKLFPEKSTKEITLLFVPKENLLCKCYLCTITAT